MDRVADQEAARGADRGGHRLDVLRTGKRAGLRDGESLAGLVRHHGVGQLREFGAQELAHLGARRAAPDLVVRRADDVVGRVLSELKAAGFDDNTVVMLKSAHGIAVPFAKTNVYRHSTITPWIVRWPGKLKPGSHDTEHLVSGIDFAPTILDILGIVAMEGMDGRSFLPVLNGQKQDGRD